MAAKDFIVAIELGSSKVTGIAGKKNMDGSMSILAVVTEDSSTFIRRGIVYNIDKTSQCISNIVQKLKNILKTNINEIKRQINFKREKPNIILMVEKKILIKDLIKKNRNKFSNDTINYFFDLGIYFLYEVIIDESNCCPY
jgi:cell division ATPase FtsA